MKRRCTICVENPAPPDDGGFPVCIKCYEMWRMSSGRVDAMTFAARRARRFERARQRRKRWDTRQTIATKLRTIHKRGAVVEFAEVNSMSDTLDLDARVCNAFGYGTRGDGPTCNGLVNEMLAELRKLREENARLKGENQHTCLDYHDPCAQCDKEEMAAHRPLPKPPEVG